MLGAMKLMTNESVINMEPTNATTRHPNFCNTGGNNGPEKVIKCICSNFREIPLLELP